MGSYYSLKQLTTMKTVNNLRESGPIDLDLLGSDLNKVLSAIVAVENCSRISRSTWYWRDPNTLQMYGSPSKNSVPHMRLRNIAVTDSSYHMRERIDYLRALNGVRQFQWVYTPSLLDFTNDANNCVIDMRQLLEMLQAIGRVSRGSLYRNKKFSRSQYNDEPVVSTISEQTTTEPLSSFDTWMRASRMQPKLVLYKNRAYHKVYSSDGSSYSWTREESAGDDNNSSPDIGESWHMSCLVVDTLQGAASEFDDWLENMFPDSHEVTRISGTGPEETGIEVTGNEATSEYGGSVNSRIYNAIFHTLVGLGQSRDEYFVHETRKVSKDIGSSPIFMCSDSIPETFEDLMNGTPGHELRWVWLRPMAITKSEAMAHVPEDILADLWETVSEQHDNFEDYVELGKQWAASENSSTSLTRGQSDHGYGSAASINHTAALGVRHGGCEWLVWKQCEIPEGWPEILKAEI